MEPILNPKKVSLTITTTNLIGRKWANIDVKLGRIDDCFYHKPREIESKTNNEGIVNFKSIFEGAYLIQISAKKVFSEEIHIIKNNASIKIKLPSLFGWFYKEKKVDKGRLKEFYEKFRIDNEVCFKCKKPYKSCTDQFKCKYCEKQFCSNHRLPENHNCWGKPKAPPGGHRVIYSGGKTTVIGK